MGTAMNEKNKIMMKGRSKTEELETKTIRKKKGKCKTNQELGMIKERQV